MPRDGNGRKPRKRASKAPRALAPQKLPHLDERGAARMVDVGSKPATHRVAMAEAFVRMKPEALARLTDGNLYKGDALSVARIAGIAGSKRTSELIPLAHPISLTHAAVDVTIEPAHGGVRVETRVETVGTTGVELEALVAAATAALAVYDMAKAHDRGMVIERVQLLMKAGGRSGTYRRKERRGETETDRLHAAEIAKAKERGKGRSKARGGAARRRPRD